MTSAPDPVVHVGDTVLPLKDPGALELVEDAGRERKLGDCGAVNKHVLVARSLLGLGHRGFEVGHVGDERPLADVDAGLPAAVDEDWDAVVVVAPAAGRLEVPRPATIAPVDMNSSTTLPLTPPERRMASRSTSPPPVIAHSCRR